MCSSDLKVRAIKKILIEAAPVPEVDPNAPPVPVEEDTGPAKPKFEEVEIPTEVVDNNDGTYTVTYTTTEPGVVHVTVDFLDDKDRYVPLRGKY